ncbi:MAG: hypothetical protein LUH43_00465 [Clostridia bacterium]|nr:hypothetical protein [Clostridia bacterium]
MNESKTVPIKDDVDFARLSEFMREMETMYPDLRVFSVGESIRGREILAARLGNPMAPTSTLYVGAHHGMEHITSAVLMRFINEYFQYRAEGRRMFGVGMDFIFERRAIYVVPMLNPDGVELSLHGADEKSPLYERLLKMNGSGDFTHWQANERGVDLNHNYNAGFVEYKRIEKDRGIFGGCASGYSGEYPESEPEVSALCGLIRTLEPNVILTLHTQGEEIYCGGDYASKKNSRRGSSYSGNDGLHACSADRERRLRRADRLVCARIRQAVLHARMRQGRKSSPALRFSENQRGSARASLLAANAHITLSGKAQL